MRPPKLLPLTIFLFISLSLSAQGYYDFSDKYPDQGHLAITPIGGIIAKSGGGTGFSASGRIQYFISEHISAGAQYVQLFETGTEDFGWLGDYGAPKSSVYAILGGHYFPSSKRLGFHGTGGLGYILSKGGSLGYYWDLGGDYKISSFLTLQLQVNGIQGVVGLGLGFQFKL